MSIADSQFSMSGGATPLTRGEAQSFARRILNSQAYRSNLESRAANGTLPPAVETMLWHYAYGKPMEQLQVSVIPGTEDLANLPIDELHRRSQALEQQLAEAVALAEAIPPEILYGSPGSASANHDTSVTH